MIDAPGSDRTIRAWVRLILVLVAMALVAVFVVAACLNPYKNGKVWLEETHRQLGFSRCTFKAVTGLPCPSCGMTSSFCLLVRGDVGNSLRANFAGTFLALALLPVVPWCISCAIRGRWWLVYKVEQALVLGVLALVALLFLRWGVVLLVHVI